MVAKPNPKKVGDCWSLWRMETTHAAHFSQNPSDIHLQTPMNALLHTSSATYLAQNQIAGKMVPGVKFCRPRNPCSFSKWCRSSSSFAQRLSMASGRKSVIVGAKDKYSKNDREDSNSFISNPDEAFFPEAVLLKEKKVTEEGKSLPEFADDEEKLLYEYLNLQLQSDLLVERMRHYEVVYLIHENHTEEVEVVNERIQDFLREKKGRIWRVSDWGMRRLAYKIKKAKKAHYILMNFELETKWINDFKSMLDKDERIIRHLVIKRDEAITEDCPPPPEFHTIRQGMDEFDEDDEIDFDEEDLDEEEFIENDEDGIVYVSSDDEVAEREVITSTGSRNVSKG